MQRGYIIYIYTSIIYIKYKVYQGKRVHNRRYIKEGGYIMEGISRKEGGGYI